LEEERKKKSNPELPEIGFTNLGLDKDSPLGTQTSEFRRTIEWSRIE
jgi:hypothetical protein